MPIEIEVVEKLHYTGDSAGKLAHWSRTASKPRYMRTREESNEAGHQTTFTCFTLAEKVMSDHDTMFSGRSDGSIVFWRLTPRNQFGGSAKGERREEALTTNSPHRGAVACLAFTRTGSYASLGHPLLFSGGGDHAIKVWNAWADKSLKERCIQTIAAHNGSLTALEFTEDASLVSCSRDGNICIWRAQGGRKLMLNPFFCCVKTLSLSGRGYNGSLTWPTTLAVEGGEEWMLYVGDSGGAVSVFMRKLPPAMERTYLTGGTQVVGLHVEQLPDREVTLDREWRHLHTMGITEFKLVPEHNFLVSISADGDCKILDYLQGALLITISNPRHTIYSGVAWDLLQEQLVLVDQKGWMEIWNTYTERVLMLKHVANAKPSAGPRRGQAVVALSGLHTSKTDGLMHGAAPNQDCFFRWRTYKNEEYVEFGAHSDEVVAMCCRGTKLKNCSDDVVVLSVSLDDTVRAWETLGMSQKWCMKAGQGQHEMSCLALMPGEALLATGNDSGSIVFWSLATGAATTFPGVHSNTVSALAAHQDPVGNVFFASASYDGDISFWTAAAKDGLSALRIPKLSHTTPVLSTDDHEVLALAFTGGPGESLLVSAGNDGFIRCWEFCTHVLVMIINADQDARDGISCLASDGCFLFSTGYDGCVRMWNLADASEGKSSLVGKMKAHEHPVNQLVITPGRGHVVTLCNEEGRVTVWDYTSPGELCDELEELDGDGEPISVWKEVHGTHNTELHFTAVTGIETADERLLVFVGCRSGEVLVVPPN
ncbi:unnamed protein product [Chrysoparadoxa australica]